MAKLSIKQLQSIFPNKVQTGDDRGIDRRTPAPPDPKKVGVIDVPSLRVLDKAPEEVLKVALSPKKTTVVVSPFASEDFALAAKMVRYANLCVTDSIKRGEAALNSQVFYYKVLNMNNPIERDVGLHSMMSWVPKADLVAVYLDFGVTQAMQVLINVAQLKGRKIEYRIVGKGV